jgi:hypothetical protein
LYAGSTIVIDRRAAPTDVGIAGECTGAVRTPGAVPASGTIRGMRGFMERAHAFLMTPVVAGSRTRLMDLLLIAWFAVLAAFDVVKSVVNWALGWDTLIYVDASRAMLRGGDAWGAAGASALFAGPPTSLLPYFAFVWLPDPLVAAGGAAVAAACALYALRKLELPAWWLLFPPVFVAILAGSSALPVTALIVRGGPIAEGLAVALRPYAVLPLAILGRWRSILVAAAVGVVTAPFLDWPRFLGKLDVIRALLNEETGGGKSAAAIWWLIPIAAASLFMLGRRRAAWLIVPALWPYSQLYYAVIALPVIAEVPFVAIALAMDLPGIVAAGLLAQVIVERLRGRELGWRSAPTAAGGLPRSAATG